MTRRVVAVRVCATVDDETLAQAMLDDVVDLLDGMQQVQVALLVAAESAAMAGAVQWPGMAALEAPGDDVRSLLDALAAVDATEAVVVSPDVPDLPPLLLGKLFSALSRGTGGAAPAEVAVCPASDGRLVAVASRLPAPAWLDLVGLDTPEALHRLSAAAPPRALHVAAGWSRTSSAEAVRRLDPGLEGWEATREWLSRRAR